MILVLGEGPRAASLAGALDAKHEEEFDPLSMRDVRRVVAKHEPSAVVWMSFWDDVDAAESAEDRAYRHNDEAVISLAAASMEFKAVPVLVSTPEVFGQRGGPFAESDEPEPRSVWAESRRRGEVHLARAAPSALIVRAGPILTEGLVYEQHLVRDGLTVGAARKTTPVTASAVAAAIVKFLDAGAKGTVHVAGEAPVRERDLYNAIAERAGLPPVRERELRATEAPSPALRADRLQALDKRLPDWRDALESLGSASPARPAEPEPSVGDGVWARGPGWTASRHELDIGGSIEGEGELAMYVELGKVVLTVTGERERDEIVRVGSNATVQKGERHRIVALEKSVLFTVAN